MSNNAPWCYAVELYRDGLFGWSWKLVIYQESNFPGSEGERVNSSTAAVGWTYTKQGAIQSAKNRIPRAAGMPDETVRLR